MRWLVIAALLAVAAPAEARGLAPLATQVLNEEELARAANLGNNGPRDVTGVEMTHCVPNEHVAVADQPVTA